MHYLQNEWYKFERDRNHWEIEKAEMKMRIAKLEGESRGTARLNDSLLRRIQMLEKALIEERQKHSANGENSDGHLTAPPLVHSDSLMDFIEITKKQLEEPDGRSRSRVFLEKCLQEVAYYTSASPPKNIPYLNVSSEPQNSAAHPSISTFDPPSNFLPHYKPPSPPSSQGSSHDNRSISRKVNGHDSSEEEPGRLLSPAILKININGSINGGSMRRKLKPIKDIKNLQKSENKQSVRRHQVAQRLQEWDTNDEVVGWDLSDEEDLSRAMENAAEQTSWKPRYALKGHLGSVKCFEFMPNVPALVSAGDDGLVKWWRLPKKGSQKNVGEIHAILTYRGHRGIVTSLQVDREGKYIYTAGQDSTIMVWQTPEFHIEIYSSSAADEYMRPRMFVGHTDAIWDIKLAPSLPLLASASADGAVKLWNTELGVQSPLVASWRHEEDSSLTPLSLSFITNERIAVAWSNAVIQIRQVEGGKVIKELPSAHTYDGTCQTQINRILALPIDNMIISAHEDRYIRFFDIDSGQCTFSMLAHLDAVSAIAASPDGETLVSGGHDASIRFWDMLASRQCIQELSTHRSKSDEGVTYLRWNSSGYIASAGGDGVIKLYWRE